MRGPLRIGGTLSCPLSPRPVSVATTRAEWAGRAKAAFRGGACGGSGVRALRALRAAEMLRAVWLRLCAALCSLLLGRAEAPSPGVPPERSRPYTVLRGQNLGERGGSGCGFADRSRRGELCGARAGLGRGVERYQTWAASPREAAFPAVSPRLGNQRSLPVCWRHLLELETEDPGLCSPVALRGLRLGSRAHPASSSFEMGPVLRDGVCN